MSAVRPVLLSCCASGALWAAVEPALADLRVGLEARPAAFKYVLNDGGRERSGNDAFASAWALATGVRYGLGAAASPHRLVLGADLLGCDERTATDTRNALLGRVAVGYAYGVSAQWTMLAGVTAAWGPARWDSGGVGPDLSGIMAEMSGEIGLRWQPGARWSVGVSAGWLQGRDRLSGDGATLTTERSGLTWGLNLGWTWDVRPHALE